MFETTYHIYAHQYQYLICTGTLPWSWFKGFSDLKRRSVGAGKSYEYTVVGGWWRILEPYIMNRRVYDTLDTWDLLVPVPLVRSWDQARLPLIQLFILLHFSLTFYPLYMKVLIILEMNEELTWRGAYYLDTFSRDSDTYVLKFLYCYS